MRQPQGWPDVGICDGHPNQPDPQQRRSYLGYEINADERAKGEEGERDGKMGPEAQDAADQDATASRERIHVTDREVVPAAVVPSVVRHVRAEVDQRGPDEAQEE